MILEMLYATHGKRIQDLINNLPQPNPKVKIMIVHQISEAEESAKSLFSHRHDVRYFPMFKQGVTKSRNFALDNAIGDVVLFCDDDVVYEGQLDKLLDLYKHDLSVGCVTGAYATPSRGILNKFASKSFKHTLRTILSVGTIEVSARLSAIKRTGALFPEDLGAGTKFHCCDEPVFLSRLIKGGVMVVYHPFKIGTHPDFSSGLDLNSYGALFSRLIAFRYIYGYLVGTILFYIFCFKKFRSISFSLLLRSFFINYH